MKKYLLMLLFLCLILSSCINNEVVVDNSATTETEVLESEVSGVEEQAVSNESVEMGVYEDDIYKIGFEYPLNWNLEVRELPGVAYSLVSKAVVLQKDLIEMVIQYEPSAEQIPLFSGLGAGEIFEDGAFTFMDQGCILNKLSYEGKTKMVWCSSDLGDIKLFISISGVSEVAYEEIDLDDFVIAEAQTILASLYRTGAVDFSGYQNINVSDAENSPQNAECVGNTQLTVNIQARVTDGLPNALRSEPGTGENSVVLGTIDGGTVLTLIEGPVCADGIYWWKVNDGTRVGWTAEGENGDAWILPYTPDQVVDGWVGVIVSSPEMAQVDDYFQMMDQNGSRFGIDGADENIRAILASYRDSGVAVQIWGTLYNVRMDAYNTQIVVDQLSEIGSSSSSKQGAVVDGWIGMVVGMPAGSQYDDYFQMMDQNGTRHGIDGMDDAMKAALENYRDSGVAIQVWGTLYTDRMDAYETQIVVDSLTEYK